MRNIHNFSFLIKQMENVIEFVKDIEPLLKSAIPNMVRHLDELERKGVFRILKSTLDIRAKIAETYTPEDIDQIGEGMVTLLGLAKKLSDPALLAFFHKTTDMLSAVELSDSKPVGPCGMASALFNTEVREGLGVLMQLTKAMAKLKDDGGALPRIAQPHTT